MDTFREVSNQGFFSRIGSSIVGVLLGGLLFVGGCPVLFFNEGCAVRSYQALQEARENVVPVASAAQVEAANDKKLVHMVAGADSEETLADPQFGISAKVIKLRRNVEMYQWEEEKREEKRKKLGGGEETITTYHYDKTWSSSHINSNSFRHPEGHTNPTEMLYRNDTQQAQKVWFGAFTLSPTLLGQYNSFEPLPVQQADMEKVAATSATAKLEQGHLYIGDNPASPAVGDTKVSFQVVRPSTVSILALQMGSSFGPFPTKAGEPIELLSVGQHTAEQMIVAEESKVAFRTWAIRFGGFFMMFIGLSLTMGPLGVLGDVIPFVGSIIRTGTTLIAGLLAAVFALVTIAVAWIFYRPLLGIILLAAAIGIIFLVFKLSRKSKPASPVAGMEGI